MASPTNVRAKWPSKKKESDFSATDFVPYISNLVNSFRKTPRPKAPALIDPVAGTTISLDDARSQTANAARAADLSTQGLDAQTGAAIRVGNLGSKMRSLSDISSKEALLNAQLGAQNRSINASISAQNTAYTNQYRDDLVNAEIAQAREQSENLANASDKYITQQANRDQIDLDREKTIIMSQAYDRGLYNRLGNRLSNQGVEIAGTTSTNPFTQYRSMATTPLASVTTPATQPVTSPIIEPQLDVPQFTPFGRMKKMMDYKASYAAGGMLPVLGEGDPTNPTKKTTKDPYYESSAALAYYKERLNEKLKNKNPEKFSSYFKGLVDLRRSGKTDDAMKYVQTADYNEYLSPDEVKTTLGEKGYQRYLESLKTVNDYNVQQGAQPLYGTVEGENDITRLNYGRRFASLQVTPSLTVNNIGRNTKYSRNYTYDPTMDKSSFVEEGDLSLRPDYVSAPEKKASGGSIHIKKENRGKFNALKKRTGKTTEELTHSKNPLTRKRAIFAQNARKWKHGYGGMIKPFA